MSAIDLLTSLGFTVHPTTLNDGGPKSHIPCGDYIYIDGERCLGNTVVRF